MVNAGFKVKTYAGVDVNSDARKLMLTLKCLGKGSSAPVDTTVLQMSIMVRISRTQSVQKWFWQSKYYDPLTMCCIWEVIFLIKLISLNIRSQAKGDAVQNKIFCHQGYGVLLLKLFPMEILVT